MGYMYALSWKTAHHRTTFGIFCNFTQKTIPEENSCKMFHFSLPILLFLTEGQGYFLQIRIKFHLRRAKGRGKRAVWGRSPK